MVTPLSRMQPFPTETASLTQTARNLLFLIVQINARDLTFLRLQIDPRNVPLRMLQIDSMRAAILVKPPFQGLLLKNGK
jgi:hypothetical protein